MVHYAPESPDEADEAKVLPFPGRDTSSKLDEVAQPPVERASRPFEARPVLPAWLVDAAQRREAARWAAAYVGHAAAFHAVRAPLYGLRIVGRSPVGLGRVLVAVTGWLVDGEARPLRQHCVSTGDVTGYMALAERRNRRVRQRLVVAGGALVAVAASATVAALTLPAVLLPATVAAVTALGVAGRRRDRPLLDSPVTLTGAAPKLTADVVLRALGSLGIAEVNKALGPRGDGITFASPITRDGAGWRADVDLPYGVTATDVLDRRDRLASGLRRPLGCVWPEPVDDAHTGRLVIWVGDQDLSRAKPTPWPLAKTGQTDVFRPIPFGTDPRGRVIEVTLFENNILVGALPGGGKTATVRVLCLAAALDPTCELRVFNLKNSDLDCAERVAHEYGFGLGDGPAEATLAMLRDLKRELERRAETLSKLPRSLAPDGKVTRELANRRNLGLHPIVAIVDECQNLFAHAEYGDEAGELAEYIIKLGRALGVVLILATQRPDRDSLPKGVSANVSIRFCLRVTGQVENDMVLGTSAYKNGIRATTLRPTDRGIGYLVGAYDEARVVRSAYIDRDEADRIALRARALRDAAGLLTGYAAGDLPSPQPTQNVIYDLERVWPAGQDKAHSDVLIHELAEVWPERYGEWTPANLSAALKPYGITTAQTWAPCLDGTPCNHTGVTRQDIHDATRS